MLPLYGGWFDGGVGGSPYSGEEIAALLKARPGGKSNDEGGGRLLDDDVVGAVPHLRELRFERLNFIGIGGQDNTVVLVLSSR